MGREEGFGSETFFKVSSRAERGISGFLFGNGMKGICD
jgi:hypothetical protein